MEQGESSVHVFQDSHDDEPPLDVVPGCVQRPQVPHSSLKKEQDKRLLPLKRPFFDGVVKVVYVRRRSWVMSRSYVIRTYSAGRDRRSKAWSASDASRLLETCIPSPLCARTRRSSVK